MHYLNYLMKSTTRVSFFKYKNGIKYQKNNNNVLIQSQDLTHTLNLEYIIIISYWMLYVTCEMLTFFNVFIHKILFLPLNNTFLKYLKCTFAQLEAALKLIVSG